MTIARVRTIFTGVAGTPWYSNFYFADDGAGSIAQDASDAVAVFWGTLAAGMAAGIAWATEPDVARFNEATGDLVGVEPVTPASGAGSSPGQPLPWATQGLVRFTTDGIVHNRRVRGRAYVPGFTEDSQSAGVPNSATVTAFTNAGATLITDSTGTLVIWSRPFAGTPATPTRPANPARAGSKHFATASTGWPKWAVQRSRRD